MPKVTFEDHSSPFELADRLSLMLFHADWRQWDDDRAQGQAMFHFDKDGVPFFDTMQFDVQGEALQVLGFRPSRLAEGRIETIEAGLLGGEGGMTITDLGLRAERLAEAVAAERSGEHPAAVEDVLLDLDWRYRGLGNDDVLPRGAMTIDGVPINMRGDDDVRLRGGDDHWFAGHGDDVVKGGSGRDFLDGGAGRDVLFGGSGADTLRGSSGDDRLRGQGGRDELRGGGGGDRLHGGSGRDVLMGGRGEDRIDGGSSGDVLMGGGGSDQLDGGRGRDVLTGGGGRDSFVFEERSGDDVITDFDVRKDRLVIATDDPVRMSETTTDRGEMALLVRWEGNGLLLMGLTGDDLGLITTDFVL